MRTAILGCGAMGTVLGAYLSKNGCPVEMIDTYEAHVAQLRKGGATITGCADFTVPVKALLPSEMEGCYDLVFLLTKQTANNEVLPHLLPYLREDSIVCTLQNGIPEPSVASYIGQERTVGGTILWGATFKAPGVSELTQDVSKSGCLFEIGEMDGQITPRIRAAAGVLEKMGPTSISTNLMGSRWYKLMANACMSGMSAACGSTFGKILSNPNASACLSELGREVKLCCEADGYQLGHPGTESLSLENEVAFRSSQALFHSIYDCQPQAKASMLQDLEGGRPTEVNMINGFVCAAGRKYGIPTPFNDAIVDIVTRIGKGELPLSMDNLSQLPKPSYL